MVPLWLPNAASQSLEKKKFVSICLGHLGPEHLVPPLSVILTPNTWSRHSFSQSNSGPKQASHGRTLAPNTWSRHSFSQSNSAPKQASHGRTLAP